MYREGRAVRAHVRAGGIGRSRDSRASFVLARTGSSRVLAASLGLAVVFSVAVTTALVGFGTRALPEAVHQRLASAPGTSVAISGQMGAATANADTQVIDSLFRSALGGVPFTLVMGRWSDDLALPQPRSSSVISTIQAAALDGIASHVNLVAGNWPGPVRRGQPIGVALPVSTARMLGLSVGRVLALQDSDTGAPVRLVVAGLFRLRDPASPYWQLSLLGTSGDLVTGTFVTYGPMLVDPDALDPGGLTVGGASWVARVDAARIVPASLPQLQQRLASLVSVLQGGQSLGWLQVTTRLPQTLSGLASSVAVSRSLLLIGSLELVLLALAAVWLAARLLASQREEETALLNARGVARGQLARASLAEAVLLAVPAAAAGTVLGGLGVGLLLSVSGLPASRAGGLTGTSRVIIEGAWWPGVIMAILAVFVMVWPAFRPAAPGEARVRRGRQPALSAVVRAGLDVALIGLGLLALWELRSYSAVQQLAGGGLGVDPVLAAAPVVALAGLSLVALRLLPAAARLLDRASARARHVDAALAGWQVSRRPRQQAGPILLMVLAIATGTLALAEHQSWRQSQLDQASFAAGADVRIDLASPLALGRAGTLAHARGVVSAMPVASYFTGFSLVALDARAAADTVLLRPDLSALPAAALWRRITPAGAGPGLALPGNPARLGITAMVRPAAQHLGALSVDLSVQDGSGIVYQVTAGNLAADGRYHQLIATLSATRQAVYPLRLLGLSASYTLPGLSDPGPAGIAAKHPRQQASAAESTFFIGGLAVSDRTAGSIPAPFAKGAALVGWHPAAVATDLADPRAEGTPPSVAAWQAAAGAAALTFTAGSGGLVERPGLPPIPVSGQLSVTAGSPATPLPAIATTAFVSSAGTGVGGVVTLQVGPVNVPARLVAEVRGFPTVASDQPAVIVDLAGLGDVLAAQSQPPLPVTEWWLRAGPGAPAGLPPGAAVTTQAGLAAALLADPLPNVQQLGALVSVVAAGLLACLGFAVSVAASVRERRLTDAVLAALGLGPAARAGQLCLEQLMLGLPAAAAGALIGVVLARLLVPAVTLTSAAAAPFPPARVEIPLILLALLALTVAAVPVAAAATTVGYRPDPAAQLRAGESA